MNKENQSKLPQAESTRLVPTESAPVTLPPETGTATDQRAETSKDEKISFRVTKNERTSLLNEAQRLGISVSEYCHAVILDRNQLSAKLQSAQSEMGRLRGEITKLKGENTGLIAEAKQMAGKLLNKDRIDQIRADAVREHVEKQASGLTPSPVLEVNRDMRTRLESYETPHLQAVFETVKGKTFKLDGRKVIQINDLPDLVTALVEVFAPQPVLATEEVPSTQKGGQAA